MGLTDEAIKQFQVALKKGPKPFEAAKLLDPCVRAKEHREKWMSFKGMLQEEGAIA